MEGRPRTSTRGVVGGRDVRGQLGNEGNDSTVCSLIPAIQGSEKSYPQFIYFGLGKTVSGAKRERNDFGGAAFFAREGLPGVKSKLAIAFLVIAIVTTLTWCCALAWLTYRLVWAVI